MKPERPLKLFLVAFLLAVIGYTISYKSIEYARTKKGPWEVVFTNTPASIPAMVINQPKLGITNVLISFFGEPPAPADELGKISFGEAHPVPWKVGFGKCVYMDTTFLPGVITFQLYGHEIELLPRVLVIDRQERKWLSNEECMVQSPAFRR
jgi:hypothetical protein